MYKILIKSGGRPQRPAGRESSVFAIARSIVQASVCSERSFSGHGQRMSFLPSVTNSLTSLYRYSFRFVDRPASCSSSGSGAASTSATDTPAFNKRTSFSGASTASRTNTTPGELLANRKCWKVVMPLIRPSTKASQLFVCLLFVSYLFRVGHSTDMYSLLQENLLGGKKESVSRSYVHVC